MTTRLSLQELQRLGLTVPTIEALLESVNASDTLNLSDQAALVGLVAGLQSLALFSEAHFVTTSTTYTTTGEEDVVVAMATTTITLNNSPEDGESVTVKRASAGDVVVDGSSNTIDGDSTFTMRNNYDAFTFRYVDDAGEWLIV